MLEISDDDFGTWLHDAHEVWGRDQWRKVARDRAVFQGIEKGILKDVTLCYLRQLEQQGWSGPFDSGTFVHEQAGMKASVLRLLLTGRLFTRDLVSENKTKKTTVCDCSVGGPADVFHVIFMEVRPLCLSSCSYQPFVSTDTSQQVLLSLCHYCM